MTETAANVSAEFAALAEPFRRQLHLHCYRMTGSLHDADDLTQTSLIRAWRGFHRLKDHSALRAWLYAIATRVCLDTLSQRARRSRLLPSDYGPPTRRMPNGEPAREITWLEPYPTAELERVPDPAPTPAARWARRDTIRLAFVAAVQHLPPKQRAVLLLCDALDFSARETALALKLSVQSVNSALQRARATLRTIDHEEPNSADSPEEAAIVERYVAAWESGDLEGIVNLLREDVALVMPPWSQWYRGRSAVHRFWAWAFDWVWAERSATAFKLLRTEANRQVALATHLRARGASSFHPHALQLLSVRDGQIAEIHLFLDADVLRRFEPPAHR